jgi:membrane protein required for colicin V production
MTQFDLIVLVLLGVSAAVGFARGAAREVAALAALVGAALFTLFTLSPAARIARHVIHTDWLAAVCAVLVVFLVVYLALRLSGGVVARHIQQTHFVGALDRSVGLAIGLVRGLIVLGALDLLFVAATPEDLRPHWIVGATTWPMAQDMGKALRAVAPKGVDVMAKLQPAVARSFGDATHSAARQALDDRLKKEGYDARQRGEIEDLVEKKAK